MEVFIKVILQIVISVTLNYANNKLLVVRFTTYSVYLRIGHRGTDFLAKYGGSEKADAGAVRSAAAADEEAISSEASRASSLDQLIQFTERSFVAPGIESTEAQAKTDAQGVPEVAPAKPVAKAAAKSAAKKGGAKAVEQPQKPKERVPDAEKRWRTSPPVGISLLRWVRTRPKYVPVRLSRKAMSTIEEQQDVNRTLMRVLPMKPPRQKKGAATKDEDD